jgi:hypothetical protein
MYDLAYNARIYIKVLRMRWITTRLIGLRGGNPDDPPAYCELMKIYPMKPRYQALRVKVSQGTYYLDPDSSRPKVFFYY